MSVSGPPLRGIITPTVTPFRADETVDFNALGNLVEHLLRAGVHGICPCGTTGEYFALHPDERKAILEFVAAAVGDRAALFAGTNALTTADVVRLTSSARDLGYSAALLGAPPISRPSRKEMVAHFLRVLDESGLPLILYNNPPRTGVDLDPEFLRELLGHPLSDPTNSGGVIGIKESSGSLPRLHALALEFGGRLEIACGDDSHALEFFLWGSRSWIAGPSNFIPSECLALYTYCVEKQDVSAGKLLMQRMLPLLKMMDEGGRFIQQCKYGCELSGVPVGNPRAPLLPLSPLEKERFRARFVVAKSESSVTEGGRELEFNHDT
jgi:4-hydroxy-tetrahydrodipicolinate synthase